MIFFSFVFATHLCELLVTQSEWNKRSTGMSFQCAEQRRKKLTKTASELSYLHWHRNWVSAMRHNKYNMCIILESGRNGPTHTHTLVHKNTDRQTLTSTHKSEQVVSTPSWTLIESISTAKGNVQLIICPVTLSCRVCSVMETSYSILSFLHPLRILQCTAYSHFWPSYALSHVT